MIMRHLRFVGALACVFFLVSFLQTEVAQAKDKSGVLKASQLIGMKVEGSDGKKLGDIKDLVVDRDDGSIDYAVLDFGGLVGIGDKYFAVPWPALRFAQDNKKLLIDVSKKDLKDAPGFDKQNWPDLSDREQVIVIYEYYGVPMTDGKALDQPSK
jgi:sporulation protein YlmC with PRC-barrel domain